MTVPWDGLLTAQVRGQLGDSHPARPGGCPVGWGILLKATAAPQLEETGLGAKGWKRYGPVPSGEPLGDSVLPVLATFGS